jgi:hemerythrin
MGIRLIDVDHKGIERLLGEVQATFAGGGSRSSTLDILGRLAAFTRTHFALEEGLMAFTGYSGYAQHRRCHQHLLQELDGFTSLYSKDELPLDRNSLRFLYSWFDAHRQNDDAQYAAWLAAQDVARGQIDVTILPSNDGPVLNRRGTRESI